MLQGKYIHAVVPPSEWNMLMQTDANNSFERPNTPIGREGGEPKPNVSGVFGDSRLMP